MPFRNRWRHIFMQVPRQLDPRSLRVGLTVGIATVSAVGMGGVALWMSWKMQNLLVVTHKQNVGYIVSRFPQDVERYSAGKSASVGLQPAIDSLSVENVLMWIEDSQGQILAQSMALKGRSDDTSEQLMDLPANQLIPEVYHINDRYYLLCSMPLDVKGMSVGQLYVAQDITNDQLMFVGTIRSLSAASLLAIVSMTVAIALYVQKSLQPLRQLSQLAETISAEDLGRTQLPLDRAPTEVRELAQTCNTMLDRLSASWEQQRQFVGNVSHELRTPLTLVSGYLQSTLRRGSNLTEMQRDALGIAAAEADRTIRLMEQLLELARADNGYLHFNLEPVSLNDSIVEVVGMARQQSHRSIVLQDPTEDIVVKADRDRLKQVIINLIDNAVKYSDAEQPVTVSLNGKD
ncbi:HAMP domain-containing protein, partial [Oscillatoriales cyanobacterium LEGE 11467]